MNKTKIDWCDYTWNPVIGCKHGCAYCYAHTLVDTRLKNIYKNFEPQFFYNRLHEPQNFAKPLNIFVCSMADLFGNWVSNEWIEEVFKACSAAPWHRYLFLTKNPSRYFSYCDKVKDFNHMPDWWFGASAETANTAHCASDDLWGVKGNTFLSIEPLHEDLADYTDFESVRWVIIGAETGNRKEKIIPKRVWIENIVESCKKFNVPVFMKNNLKSAWKDSLIREYPWENQNEQINTL